jgi:hypothetical protein
MVLKSQKCDLHILTQFYPEKERKNENNPKRYFKEKPRKTGSPVIPCVWKNQEKYRKPNALRAMR